MKILIEIAGVLLLIAGSFYVLTSNMNPFGYIVVIPLFGYGLGTAVGQLENHLGL